MWIYNIYIYKYKYKYKYIYIYGIDTNIFLAHIDRHASICTLWPGLRSIIGSPVLPAECRNGV